MAARQLDICGLRHVTVNAEIETSHDDVLDEEEWNSSSREDRRLVGPVGHEFGEVAQA